MTLPTLYTIAYSPWSFKARWAANHAAAGYHQVDFVPLLSNLRLRAAARRWTGRITVPCWIEGDLVLMDSYDIARHVDTPERTLFPEEHLPAIAAWNERSEACLAAGRAATTASVAGDPEALRASVPPPFERMRPLALGIGRYGVRYLRRKYDFADSRPVAWEETIQQTLRTLREALSGGGYLCGDTLTWADVAMAVGLCFVKPPECHPLPAVTRPHWTRATLAAEYDDVLAWRDRIYGVRPPATPRRG